MSFVLTDPTCASTWPSAAEVTHAPGRPWPVPKGRISLNRILDRMTDIRISETSHGAAGARRYEYEPTFILRGLTELHLEFEPLVANIRSHPTE